jgi:rubrerythrin
MSPRSDKTDTGKTGAGAAGNDPLEALAEGVASADDVLAHAFAMETEAADRYHDLADQMEVHNNSGVAEIFDRMARIEQIHADKLEVLCRERGIERRSPWDYRWIDPEAPEVTPVDEAHYLLPALQALKLALNNEKRAVAFYEALAARSPNPEVKALAEEFAEEEREHVALVEKWIDAYPDGTLIFPEDPDEPVAH